LSGILLVTVFSQNKVFRPLKKKWSFSFGGKNLEFRDVGDVRVALQSALDSIAQLEARMAATLGELRQAEIRLRRARDMHFPPSYFADVAWDILLDLDWADERGVMLALSDLGVEAKIPLSTTMRYVQKMETDGFVVRQLDSKDRRRTIVALTDKGREAMKNIFGGVANFNSTALQMVETENDLVSVVRAACG
jgi:DNA-binding MarR family transcriptional regulator